MSGEGPDTKVFKASLAYRAKYKSKRHRPRIEPAEMRHSCWRLTPIHENVTHPASDSEDTADSDMPELVDPEPLKRSESDDGLFRFHTDGMAQNRDKWAIMKKEKRRSRSTGWKHFPEPGGGHIDYSKVPSGNRLRALVCTLN